MKVRRPGHLASFPDQSSETGFSRTQTCVRGERVASFLTWSWRNQNRTRVFRTVKQCFSHCLTNYAFNAQCVWYSLPDNQRCVVSYLLPSLFFLFWVFGYAHSQLRSLYPLYTWRDKTYSPLLTQLQCSRSRVWEPGNKATQEGV